jgi:hypothetical protein
MTGRMLAGGRLVTFAMFVSSLEGQQQADFGEAGTRKANRTHRNM